MAGNGWDYDWAERLGDGSGVLGHEAKAVDRRILYTCFGIKRFNEPSMTSNYVDQNIDDREGWSS